MDPTAKELTAVSMAFVATVAIVAIVFTMALLLLIVVGIRNAREANAKPDHEYVVTLITDEHNIVLKERSSGYILTMKVENAYDPAFVPGTVIIMPKTIQP